MNDEAARQGRPAQHTTPPPETIPSRPELHVVLAPEEPPTVQVWAYDFAQELRLCDDLTARTGLALQVQHALEDALEVLRARRASAVPGDLAA
jgi:hypothetical protein